MAPAAHGDLLRGPRPAHPGRAGSARRRVRPGPAGRCIVSARKPPPDPVKLWTLYHDHLRNLQASRNTILSYRTVLLLWFEHLERRRTPKAWWRATPADLEAFLDRGTRGD